MSRLNLICAIPRLLASVFPNGAAFGSKRQEPKPKGAQLTTFGLILQFFMP